jgi:hypothetical protein
MEYGTGSATMVKELIAPSVLLSVLLCAGCGTYEPPDLPPIDYYLVIYDSIGVEAGDGNYMLNWPRDAAFTPEGDIAVVDMMRHEVLFYGGDGEFIGTIGCKGEGPGTFSNPHGIEFYSDGSFLISCRNGVSLFNSDCEFIERMQWDLLQPHVVKCQDSGGFIGRQLTFDGDAQRIMATSTLGLWEDSDQSVEEFYSVEYRWQLPSDDAIDMTNYRETGFIACASREGRMFYYTNSVDRFEITGLEPDGTEFFHVVDEQFHPVRKTGEELQDEMEGRESLANRIRGEPLNREVRLDPLKPAIGLACMEGNERLWVWLGSYPGMVFRVYGMDGEILFHAAVDYPGDPVDLRNWVPVIDEYGYLMFPYNPQDTPRIYLLELVEAGESVTDPEDSP